jgi:hypothetical protein
LRGDELRCIVATSPSVRANMIIDRTKPLFAWDRLEDSPSLETIREFLAAVPDGRLLEGLRAWGGTTIRYQSFGTPCSCRSWGWFWPTSAAIPQDRACRPDDRLVAFSADSTGDEEVRADVQRPLGRPKCSQGNEGLPTGETENRPTVLSTSVQLVVEKIPLFVLVAAGSIITYRVQGKSIAWIATYPLSSKIQNCFISYVTYLEQLFWPTDLAVSYPRLPLDLPQWRVWSSLAVLLIITIVALLNWRRRPYWIVGWLWYLGMLAPVIGFLQIGVAAVADRFTYLAQIGTCFAVVWGIADFCELCPRWRVLAGVAAVASIFALMVCSWQQTAYWRDSETMWRRSIACNAEDPFALGGLGMTLQQSGRVDESIPYYRNAKTAQIAIEMASAQRKTDLVKTLTEQLLLLR